MQKIYSSKYFWVITALVCSFLFKTPVLPIVIGILTAILFDNPQKKFTNKLSKYSLQFSVVLLGFGLNLGVVMRVGKDSIGITFLTITLTMALGMLIGKLYSVNKELRALISGGTAICGGSAIAALSPAIGASASNTSISLAVVFLLNAVALIIFPPLGHFFDLSQTQFGAWVAIAIHDTSSVVGAASAYGAKALEIGTTVKLTRALWILPLSIVATNFFKTKNKTKFQWFLVFFLLASATRSYFTSYETIYTALSHFGKQLLNGTLFLIGAGISKDTIKEAGLKSILFGITLWLIISAVSLVIIKYNIISF